MTVQSKNPLVNLIEREASLCVKCGLCLPHCPTYQLTQDENESPRGRIALLQALNQNQLPLTDNLKQHLDRCLGCRACERVCPTQVKYGPLLTAGRALGAHQRTRISYLLAMMSQMKVQRILHWLLWGVQKSGLRCLAQKLHLPRLLGLARFDQLLPCVQKPLSFQTQYPAFREPQQPVMLFKGCINSLCDQSTLLRSIYVLQRLGFKVIVPQQQGCCGAIPLYSAQRKQALKSAQQNIQAFAGSASIVTVATGCSALLQEYHQHFSSDLQLATLENFSNRVVDILHFIHQHWAHDLPLQPVTQTTVLHIPCTSRNVLKTSTSVAQLLSYIPQLKVIPLQAVDCCGAAGSYMLEQPQIADSLAQNLLHKLPLEVDSITTANIGCALHLQRHLKLIHSSIRIIHPIELIAQALGYPLKH